MPSLMFKVVNKLTRIYNILKEQCSKHVFLFIVLLWYLILQRIDVLVCPRLEYDFSLLFTWWVFMPCLVVLTALLIYYSDSSNIWKPIFFILCYPGMLLDFLYIIEIPTPKFWLDTSFIWWWHPAYLIFGYPWTIKEQIVYWSISFICLTIVYIKKILKR